LVLPNEEQRIIDAVCAVLAKHSLMTKELVVELAAVNLDIKKKELNQLLYRRKDTIVGLSVSKDFVWSFCVGACGKADHATVRKNDRKASAPTSSSFVSKAPVTRAPLLLRTLDFPPDPDQLAVISEPRTARVFVEAGPGTGKTAVACRRISRLILEDDVNPANILVISFTRTAVAEIRNRIAHYVTRGSASQVWVSTIDSSAWQLESVYGEGSKDWSSKGFDGTIESALSLIQKKDASLKDLLETFEHVVVDEAQDITGIRNDFVIELVRALPKQCGVTIFADPMQSIYGFTLSSSAEAATGNPLVETVGGEHPVDKLQAGLSTFKQMQLSHTHRFSNELDEVLAKARTVVQSEEFKGVEKQQQLGQGIHAAAEQLPHDYLQIADLVRDDSSALLLFRYRREVVQASSFLSSSGVPHRVRMPQLPECIQPWVARVFWDYTKTTIDRSAFTALFQQRCEPRLSYEPSEETAWELLRRLAPEHRESVKIGKLRNVLARPRPPVDACYLDSGPTGPTLGTIHASKGREAESVYLFVPPVIMNGDVEEESRVLYVAATRARTRLLATRAFKANAKRLNKHGRCFILEETKNGKMGKMEVGLSGDLHHIMSVSNRLYPRAQDSNTSQNILWGKRGELASLRAKRTGRGNEYRLSLLGDDPKEEHDLLGALSVGVFEDARTIASKVGKSALPSWDLQFLFLAGSRTHVISADASGELEHAHEPYRTTGFFLVPHIRGYCRFYINNTGK
jgi:hypothetical protein